jgi:hypothetical protein
MGKGFLGPQVVAWAIISHALAKLKVMWILFKTLYFVVEMAE